MLTKKSIEKNHFKSVVIGGSAGGIDAIQTILKSLPPNFPLSLSIVQHRHPTHKSNLANLWQNHCALPVKEADEKEKLIPGHVYVAPANYHLLIDEDFRFALTNDERVHHSRPSIDILFETAAVAFGKHLIGVILTGANADGSQGLRRIQERGGGTIVQDPSTAEVPIMPRSALASSEVDWVVPLEEIGPLLANIGKNKIHS